MYNEDIPTRAELPTKATHSLINHRLYFCDCDIGNRYPARRVRY